MLALEALGVPGVPGLRGVAYPYSRPQQPFLPHGAERPLGGLHTAFPFRLPSSSVREMATGGGPFPPTGANVASTPPMLQARGCGAGDTAVVGGALGCGGGDGGSGRGRLGGGGGTRVRRGLFLPCLAEGLGE